MFTNNQILFKQKKILSNQEKILKNQEEILKELRYLKYGRTCKKQYFHEKDDLPNLGEQKEFPHLHLTEKDGHDEEL